MNKENRYRYYHNNHLSKPIWAICIFLSGLVLMQNVAAQPRSILLGLSECQATDLDGDGGITAGDLNLLALQWGHQCTTGESDCADLDGDGVIDRSDIAILQAHWQETCAPLPTDPALIFLASTSEESCAAYDDNQDGVGERIACQGMVQGLPRTMTYNGTPIDSVIGLFAGNRFICALRTGQQAVCWDRASASATPPAVDEGLEAYILDIVRFTGDVTEDGLSVCVLMDKKPSGTTSSHIPNAIECTDDIQGVLYAP